MKITAINVNVEFTAEDLVQILSDATYGSNDFDIDVPEGVREEMEKSMGPEKYDQQCWEDILAYALLHGYKLEVTDNLSEELVESWKPEGNGAKAIRCDVYDTWNPKEQGKWGHVVYEVGLEDFSRAASTTDGFELIQTFVNENDDFYTGWNFLQLVLFNELVYG